MADGPTLALALDATGMRTGAEQARAALAGVEAAANRVDASMTKTQSGVSLVGVGLGRLTGVLAALGTAKFVGDVQRMEDRLFELSKTTGISVETLSVFQFAAQKAGSNVDEVARAARHLAKAMDEARDPASEAAANLRRVGIEEKDLGALSRDLASALAVAGAGLANTGSIGAQNAISFKLFGRESADATRAIIEMSRELPSARAELEALGGVVTEKAAANADRLGDNWIRLKAALTPVGEFFNTIAADVTGGSADVIMKLRGIRQEAEQVGRTPVRIRIQLADEQTDDQRKAFEQMQVNLQTLRAETASVGRSSIEQEREETIRKAKIETLKLEAGRRQTVIAAIEMEANARAKAKKTQEASDFIRDLRDEIAAIKENSAASADEITLRAAARTEIGKQSLAINDLRAKLQALGDVSSDPSKLAESFKLKDQIKELEAFESALKELIQTRRRLTAETTTSNFLKGIEDEVRVLRQATNDPSRRQGEIQRLAELQQFDELALVLGDHNKAIENEIVARNRRLVIARQEERERLQSLATAKAKIQTIQDEIDVILLSNEAREQAIALRDFDRDTGNLAAKDEEIRRERELLQLKIQQKQALERLKSAADDYARTIAQGLEDAVYNSENLLDSIRQLGLELSRIGFRTFFTGPATNFLSGLFSGFGQSLFGSARGNVFTGGNVMPFAGGGVIDRPVMFPLRNGTGLAGEAGPEAIMPLERGPGGKLGVRASAGTSTVVNQRITIYANESADGARRSQLQVGKAMRRAVGG